MTMQVLLPAQLHGPRSGSHGASRRPLCVARAGGSRWGSGDRYGRYGEAGTGTDSIAEDLASIASDFASSVKEALGSGAENDMREAFKERLRDEARKFRGSYRQAQQYGAGEDGAWPGREQRFGGRREYRYPTPGAPNSLPCDIVEDEGGYSLFADVPGMTKGDLKIKVDARSRNLTVSGERRRPAELEVADPEGTPKGPPGGKRQLERAFGKFSRTFILSKKCDTDAITARVEKGVLHLYVQKKAPEEPSNTVDVPIWD